MRCAAPATLAALMVLLAAPAFAQPAQNGALTALMAADKDKDGRWNKEEWLAAGRREQGFAFIDADKDGYVTRTELAAGVEKMRAMGMATPN